MAYAKYLARLNRPPVTFRRDYANHINQGRLFVIGDPIIGVISLTPDDGTLVVENAAVIPHSQGRGVGRLLMDFAESFALEHDCHRIELFTNELMIENIEMYMHLGYEEVDRRDEDGYRRVYMEKRLGGAA
jgi:ribosomal protein S18 acetylase RimI-like enzyme